MSDESIDLTLHTPAGPLAVQIPTTTEKVPVTDVTKPASMLSDALSGVAEQLAARNGTPIQCREGCAACCHHLVPVSPFEAIALAEAYAELPEDRRARVRTRIDALQERLRETGLRERLDAPPGGEEGRQLVFDYFALNEPCPFLEDSGACGVYARRPHACRDLVVASDPIHCEDPASGQVRRLPTLMDVGRAIRSVGASVFPDLPLRIPLVDAIDWADEHPHVTRTVARGVDLVNALKSALAKQPS